MKNEYIAPQMNVINVKLNTLLLTSGSGLLAPGVDPMDEQED